MKRPVPRRSSLFLMELIFSILFFSLASAVCMQLFAAASGLSTETSQKSHALMRARNVCDLFQAEAGDLSSVHEKIPASMVSDSSVTVYYDDSWEECSREDASFTLFLEVLTTSHDGRLHTGKVTVTNNSGEELVSLDASSYTHKKEDAP